MDFIIRTQKRNEILDITDKVKDYIKKNAKSTSKLCIVYVQHTTASVIINENEDPMVCEDILDFLNKIVPRGIWKNDKSRICDRDNADAHIKASILGCSIMVPIANKELQLGQYQNIFFVELDGPRERKVVVTVI